MKKLLSACVMILALTACGGAADTPGGDVPCMPGGTWKLTDTRMSGTGACTGMPATTVENAIVAVMGPGNQIAWTEMGVQFTGSIDMATCVASVTGTATTAANGVTVTAKINRTMTFNGMAGTATGAGGGTFSLDVAATGFPCGTTFTTAGARQ